MKFLVWITIAVLSTHWITCKNETEKEYHQFIKYLTKEYSHTIRLWTRFHTGNYWRFATKVTRILDFLQEKTVNNKCSSDLKYMVGHTKQKAVRVFDAWGKLPSGVLLGNYLWIGDYKECLDVHVPPDGNASFTGFSGQYCLSSWDINIPENAEASRLPLKVGICVPNSCKGSEIMNDMQAVLNISDHIPYVKKYSSMFTLTSVKCEDPSWKLDQGAVSFLIVFGVICCLVALGSSITAWAYMKKSYQNSFKFGYAGSLLDGNAPYVETLSHESFDSLPDDENFLVSTNAQITSHSNANNASRLRSFCSRFRSLMKEFLLCFCIFLNGSKILSTHVNEGDLTCIHGIRVLSMMWIILGHTYVHIVPVIENIVDAGKSIDNLAFQVVLQGSFAVDSFFLLSGFLLTFLYLREVQKPENKISWFYMCLHRYWRLTPPYAMLIGFATVIFNFIGSGPFWGDITDFDGCAENWWWNLLYISNFLSINKMCAAWTWYLANDMQFYIICIPLLYALWRWPRIGLGFAFTMLITSWVTTWGISQTYHAVPFLENIAGSNNYTDYQEQIYHVWDHIYSKPWCRIGPYLIGVIAAYFAFKTRHQKGFMSLSQQLCGWSIASFCALSVIYGLYHIKYHNQVVFNFYNALSRSSFCLGLAWVVYNCLTGHAGLVNRILSYNLWIPLSRLTYCAYLVHPLIMTWYYQSLLRPLHFSQATIILNFFSFLMMSYGIAFIASLLFEAPMLALDKWFWKKMKSD